MWLRLKMAQQAVAATSSMKCSPRSSYSQVPSQYSSSRNSSQCRMSRTCTTPAPPNPSRQNSVTAKCKTHCPASTGITFAFPGFARVTLHHMPICSIQQRQRTVRDLIKQFTAYELESDEDSIGCAHIPTIQIPGRALWTTPAPIISMERCRSSSTDLGNGSFPASSMHGVSSRNPPTRDPSASRRRQLKHRGVPQRTAGN